MRTRRGAEWTIVDATRDEGRVNSESVDSPDEYLTRLLASVSTSLFLISAEKMGRSFSECEALIAVLGRVRMEQGERCSLSQLEQTALRSECQAFADRGIYSKRRTREKRCSSALRSVIIAVGWFRRRRHRCCWYRRWFLEKIQS